MPWWSIAIPLSLLALHDYRSAARDPNPYRAKLRRWRARGAGLAATSALLIFLPGLLIRITTAQGWREYGPFTEVGLIFWVLGVPFSLGLGVALVSWMGLATYHRYSGQGAPPSQ